jgi:hypothetical protein
MRGVSGWEMHQEVGMGIINPGSCSVVTKPDNMTFVDFKILVLSWVRSIQGNESNLSWSKETLLLNNEDLPNFISFVEKGMIDD